MFELITTRLTLRDFRPEDLSSYFCMTQDEKYRRFYSAEDVSMEKAAFLVHLFQEQATAIPRTHFQLAVCDRNTGEFIGTAGLRLESEGKASVGCGFRRQFHHSGLAEEAMISLLSFGVKYLGINLLYAETLAANKAAIRLCKKMGMVEIEYRVGGVLFADRKWDTVVLSKWIETANECKEGV
ncbi:GNAT family N-acetyltransferase [Grimontia marina]|uniref:N-acetyltransferase domain-containing protein n=1 Tax=Grimontia marina TaxID=646534 RepID=A0A128FG46_9GAMM|nr:GNAT family N-acetyltransferase [Grimontia marina]CZF85748.1 hypothetical protein GMA8713_03781 [Grimontia marina]